jgi:hypothetical protein
MNLKVAHLVSVQFGIFVGIVACLVFFRFEFARPRAVAEVRKPATERAAALAPRSEPEDEAADIMNDGAAPDQAERSSDQLIPAMPNEYSPEAVEKSRAILARLYYEQIAPRRNASSTPANNSIPALAPTYTEVAPEPEVVQAEYPAPQTVAYAQPTQVIVYPQPAQFVSFARPRRFVNRCRPALHPNGLGSNPRRQPDRGGMTHLSPPPAFEIARPSGSFGVVNRQNSGAQFCPSTHGSKPQGKR